MKTVTFDEALWRLVPETDAEDMLCPLCGGDPLHSCDLKEDNGGECPWEMSKEDE